MKVVRVDNFDRDYIPERLMAEKLTDEEARVIATALNAHFSGPHASHYFRVMADDYQPLDTLNEEGMPTVTTSKEPS